MELRHRMPQELQQEAELQHLGIEGLNKYKKGEQPTSTRHMAMGQNPLPAVNIPIPTKMD